MGLVMRAEEKEKERRGEEVGTEVEGLTDDLGSLTSPWIRDAGKNHFYD